MMTRRGDLDLTAELRALRPSPSTAFADELDARAAAGFAKDERSRKGPFSAIARAIHRASPQRLALSGGGAALAALVIATAVVAIDQGSHTAPSPPVVAGADEQGANGRRAEQFSERPHAESGLSSAAEKSAPGAGYQYSAAPNTVEPQSASGIGVPATAHRDVERDAELVLRSEPGEIGEDASEVFAMVHASRGIVLNSSIHDWTANAGNRGAEARADFELLIPTARLNDTLASLSRIADVRSRHESTLDITAPTVGVAERLSDAEARIESLLAQLTTAGSDDERAAVESELRRERGHAAVLGAQLDRLRQRSHFAHVSLRIESGQAGTDSGSGTWGVGDALDDAGRILTIAAGVVVIGIAMLAPLALIAALAWLTLRTWRRQRRERALG